MRHRERPLVWLRGSIKTPPFSESARKQAGFLLRLLQQGVALTLPISKPMPTIGDRCHELRISDCDVAWRIVYRLDPDAVIVLEIFRKRTRTTPRHVIAECKRRLRRYENESG